MYLHQASGVLYLASPRTASMSVADALMSQCGFVSIKGHHDAPSDWASFKTVLTTVRNPWDTAASWMFWASQLPPWTVVDIEQGLAKAHKWIDYRRLFRHAPNADVILRYETLENDLSAVLAQHGLPPLVLSLKNVSDVRAGRHYTDLYDLETSNHIGNRFADEIARFDYTF